MKLPEKGELWAPAPGDLTKQGLEDYRTGLEAIGITPPTLEGTEIHIRLSTIDAMLQPIFYNQAIKADATDWQVASPADLRGIAARKQMPEIKASPSEGPVTVSVPGGGAATFPDGMEGKLSTGQFVRVLGNHLGVTNAGTVIVRSAITGQAANVPAGTKGKWTAPPINVGTEFVVGDEGLRDGGDAETPEELRERIRLEELSRPRAEIENWGFLASLARESHSAVQAAFVYPCLGGPASAKVVVTARRNKASGQFSRAVSDSVLGKVKQSVRANVVAFCEILTQTPSEVQTDVALKVSAVSGASIWAGAQWPKPAGAYPVQVTSVTSGGRILSIAHAVLETIEPPTGSLVSLAWWCHQKRTLAVSRATVVNDPGPPYVRAYLENPFVVDGVTIAPGDVVFPALVNAEAYCETIDSLFYALGPGENYGSTHPFNQNDDRGFRLPRPEIIYPSTFDQSQLYAVKDAHRELAKIDFISITGNGIPAVPASRNTAPNILALRQLGIYPW